jgi:PAS domain S-box-containing protein
MFLDITKFLQTQEALRRERDLITNITKTSPVGIVVLNKQGMISFANAQAEKVLGISKDSMTSLTYNDPEWHITSIDGSPFPEKKFPFQIVRRTGKSVFDCRHAIQWPDGKRILLSINAAPLQDDKNRFAGMVGTVTDITQQVMAEKDLRFTQFSIDRTSEPAFWMGEDACFIYVNQAACLSLGYTKKELLALTVHDVDPSFPKKIWIKHWQKVKAEGSFTMESRHKTKDGRIFPVEITVNYLEFEGKEYNCAFARDISQRKEAEEALRASEEQYRHLIQHSNDAIYLLYNRKFILINEQFKRMLNVTEEYLNRPNFDFMELIAPQSRALVEERNRSLARGVTVTPRYTFTALSRDGREIEVEASVSYVKYKDGVATQGIIRDLSERKKLEEKLRQAHKMEALGTLAGGIAHNFNNILMGIQGRTSLMLMHKDTTSPDYEHLKGIEEYVMSAAELTKQLLGFARGGKYEVTPLHINTLLKKSARMFGSTKKEVEIEENYQKGLWATEVDIGQMEQVFLNLFVNAWQAMPGGGRLVISTNNIRLSEKEARPMGKKAGRYVKITICDNGVGMDAATTERIFDPFFTTKEMGRGTGLGLATVYGILQNHGGFVTVESEKGLGTTFNLFLPASRKKPQTKPKSATATKKGKETILLVDDEEMILEVTSSMLQQAGYKVFMTRSGQEALEVYKKKGSGIHLVILDMVMPEMSGGKTYDRLKELSPEIKVLLSSGYSMNEQASQILKRGCNGFIQKPFNSKELTGKIRKILDA